MNALIEWTMAVLSIPFLALAVYRLWRLVAVDQITEPIRDLFIWNDTQPWKWITDLIGCPWCLGFWFSGVAAVAYVGALGLSWWWVLLLWPAVSCVVGFLGKLDD
jgi:hypothetical protein